jgi:nuclear RNA export factor
LFFFFSQLVVKVKPDLPHVELNSALKEKIKAALVKRYNAELKALDLSRFHADPGKRTLIHTPWA